MAKSEDHVCGGFVSLYAALLFAGITDMIVAVSYLVSIASAFSKTSAEEKLPVTELTIRCFVPIVSFTAAFLLSFGIMIRLPWLLIFHLAKSVILASTLGLKSVLDIHDIVRTQHFELLSCMATALMAVYAMMEVWFFLVVRKAYIKMIRADALQSAVDGCSTVLQETIVSKPAKLDERAKVNSRFRNEQDRLNRAVMATVPAVRSDPNCYYEIPIHQIPTALSPSIMLGGDPV